METLHAALKAALFDLVSFGMGLPYWIWSALSIAKGYEFQGILAPDPRPPSRWICRCRRPQGSVSCWWRVECCFPCLYSHALSPRWNLCLPTELASMFHLFLCALVQVQYDPPMAPHCWACRPPLAAPCQKIHDRAIFGRRCRWDARRDVPQECGCWLMSVMSPATGASTEYTVPFWMGWLNKGFSWCVGGRSSRPWKLALVECFYGTSTSNYVY